MEAHILKFTAAVCALCVIVSIVCAGVCSSDESRAHIVAIIGFSNRTNDASLDWLSTGLVETLSAKLAQAPSVVLVQRVRLSEAAKELKKPNAALSQSGAAVEMGRALGAQTVVIGAIEKNGERIRISARFIDAATAAISNSVTAEGEAKDIFDIQDRVASALMSTLGVRVPSEVDAKMRAKPTADLAAYEAYCRGVLNIQAGDYEAAAKELEQATEKDPSFQLARQTPQFAQWAKPTNPPAIYTAEVDNSYERTYDAMLSAVKQEDEFVLQSENRKLGTIVAACKGTLLKSGMDLAIDLKPIGGIAGISVFVQTKRTLFGLRQKADLSETRKSVKKILEPFYEQTATGALRTDQANLVQYIEYHRSDQPLFASEEDGARPQLNVWWLVGLATGHIFIVISLNHSDSSPRGLPPAAEIRRALAIAQGLVTKTTEVAFDHSFL